MHKVLYVSSTRRKCSTYQHVLKEAFDVVTMAYVDNDRQFHVWHRAGAEERTDSYPIPGCRSRAARWDRWPLRHIRFFFLWLRFLRAVRRLSRDSRYDVVICEAFPAALSAYLARSLGYVDKVVYYVQDWFPSSRLAQRCDRLALRLSDATWDLSPRIQAVRRQRWPGVDLRETQVVPLLLDPPGADSLSRPGSAAGPQICYVGMVRPEAGLDLAVRAVEILKARKVDVTLVVAGRAEDPRVTVELEALVRSLDVADRVRLPGYVPETDMPAIVGQSLCGLSLTPSGEGNYSFYVIPGKIKEYMTYGIPVIVSQGSYAEEMLVPAGAALAAADSAESVADAIQQFVGDEAVAARARDAVGVLVRRLSDPAALIERIRNTDPVVTDTSG